MKYESLVRATEIARKLESALSLEAGECTVVVAGRVEMYADLTIKPEGHWFLDLGTSLAVYTGEDDGPGWEYHSAKAARALRIKGLYLHGEVLKISEAEAITAAVTTGKAAPADYAPQGPALAELIGRRNRNANSSNEVP